MKIPATDLHPLVQEYLHELHVLRQLSPHTLKAYGMDLGELQTLAADDDVELLKVTVSAGTIAPVVNIASTVGIDM